MVQECASGVRSIFISLKARSIDGVGRSDERTLYVIDEKNDTEAQHINTEILLKEDAAQDDASQEVGSAGDSLID